MLNTKKLQEELDRVEEMNAKLQAQLASYVEVLSELSGIVDFCVEEQSLDDIDSFTTQPARILLNSLPATARLDAEILRCAERQYDEWIRPYPEGNMKTYEDSWYEDSCEKTNNAVRKRNEYA